MLYLYNLRRLYKNIHNNSRDTSTQFVQHVSDYSTRLFNKSTHLLNVDFQRVILHCHAILNIVNYLNGIVESAKLRAIAI